MAMEELELTDAQAQALLESPSPLADVYRYFEKLETGYMDMIRDSIENRADDVCKAQEELRTAPLYPHSAAYASEHGEMAQYNRSYQANSACKEAIEKTISAHYAENRLDTEVAVKDVLEKFGTERVQFILGNTIQQKNHDGRISQDNKAWAKTIPMPEDSDASRHCAYLVGDGVNLGLTDLFTRQARKTMQEQQKSFVLEKLRQEPPAHKPGSPEETGAGAITSPKRKRDVPVLFWVSADEMELIQQKMAQFGTENLSAYLRKMAVDGYVVQLDLPELKELVSLLRRSSNNLNQLTRKVHETGRIYDADLEDISQRQEQLWDGVKEILTRLAKLS